MKLAIVTNFEQLGARQALRFNRLSLELERRDTRLLLLTTNVCPELTMLYLQIPYALREFTHLGVGPRSLPNEDGLLSTEEHWIRDFDREESRAGARHCRSFYEQLFEHLQPDFVAPWNTLFPHSRIVQLLCEERDIPNSTIERGLLPDTLMLDRLRNNVESELNNSTALASVARGYAENTELLDAYLGYYKLRAPSKYNCGTEADVSSQKQLLNGLNKPLVLALGQAHGAGIYPRTSRLARRNFAHFDTIDAALEQLKRAAGDRFVGFRDHPINRLERPPTAVPQGVLQLDYGPLSTVLPHAQIVVAFGSTTALYEALLLEIPVVVVGDTPLARFEPYVRCTDGDLTTALQRALDTGSHAERKKRARSALSFVLEHFLFAEHEEVPVAHGIKEMADFIASFDTFCPTPLESRFKALGNWISG